MKTIPSKLFLTLVLLMIALVSVQADTYNLTGTSGSGSVQYEDYTNDMEETWIINTGTYQPITITYDYDLEPIWDYMHIYSISNSGVETLIFNGEDSSSWTASGTISTSIPTGRAKVVFISDFSACYADGDTEYTGFSFSYTVGSYTYSQSYLTEGNSVVAGKLGIGVKTPLEMLHVNGSIRGSETGGAVKVNTTYGYLTLGPQSSTYAHLITDRSYFSLNKPIMVSNSNGYLTMGALSTTYANFVTGNTAFHFNKQVTIAPGTLSSLNTNLTLKTTGTTRMTILNSNGYVGINTGSGTPTQALTVKGNLSLSPSGTTSIETYNGNLMITKPFASGQYINLSRTGASTQWSIGTVYNSSNFAIGPAQTMDTSFTAPPFVINSAGKVGIGTIYPSIYAKLDLRGNMYIYSGTDTNYVYWEGHRMVMGTPPNSYCHNTLMLCPGGSDQGELLSRLELWHANSKTDKEKKINIISKGYTYFNGGNVGIGTTTPAYTLDVKGIIRATEVKIQSIDNFADFVFDSHYELPKLSEVDDFIQTNGHLPGIPSAEDAKENGINLVDMQVKLLQKVEELTLYAIEQQQRIEEQSKIMLEQQKRVEELEKILKDKK